MSTSKWHPTKDPLTHHLVVTEAEKVSGLVVAGLGLFNPQGSPAWRPPPLLMSEGDIYCHTRHCCQRVCHTGHCCQRVLPHAALIASVVATRSLCLVASVGCHTRH